MFRKKPLSQHVGLQVPDAISNGTSQSQSNNRAFSVSVTDVTPANVAPCLIKHIPVMSRANLSGNFTDCAGNVSKGSLYSFSR